MHLRMMMNNDIYEVACLQRAPRRAVSKGQGGGAAGPWPRWPGLRAEAPLRRSTCGAAWAAVRIALRGVAVAARSCSFGQGAHVDRVERMGPRWRVPSRSARIRNNEEFRIMKMMMTRKYDMQRIMMRMSDMITLQELSALLSLSKPSLAVRDEMYDCQFIKRSSYHYDDDDDR